MTKQRTTYRTSATEYQQQTTQSVIVSCSIIQ